MSAKEEAGKRFEALRRASAMPKAEREAQHEAAERIAEEDVADAAEVRRIEREERGITLSLDDEVREAAMSTRNAALQQRRIREVIARRSGEVTATLALHHDGDALGALYTNHLLGMEHDSELGRPVPSGQPARERIELQRLDAGPRGRFEPFEVKVGIVSANAAELRELSRAWAAAGRTGDSSALTLRVEPDAATGKFSLPPRAALACLRAFKDTARRKRNRAAGADHRPVVVELAAVQHDTSIIARLHGGAA